ncbi:hypothetical protein ANN_10956 [Periplaneta americana]|uniref:ISXO2-like transposase domain-containing protein n=1 Tax=Periplaneta americana TaxID=6978 RepID=A0ABQ8T528_PERAM|nr:hypothetical protein ANN_10956 [Periplaneta americana]
MVIRGEKFAPALGIEPRRDSVQCCGLNFGVAQWLQHLEIVNNKIVVREPKDSGNDGAGSNNTGGDCKIVIVNNHSKVVFCGMQLESFDFYRSEAANSGNRVAQVSGISHKIVSLKGAEPFFPATKKALVILLAQPRTASTVERSFSSLRSRGVRCNFCVDSLDRPRIGGPNHIVEIDECKIGRGKFEAGRIVEGSWVLDVIDLETKEVRLEICPNNDKDSLFRLIWKHVAAQTTIMTDCWKRYEGLDVNNFRHLTVNHILNFVDPESGACTNLIENAWRGLKLCFHYCNCAGIMRGKQQFPLLQLHRNNERQTTVAS